MDCPHLAVKSIFGRIHFWPRGSEPLRVEAKEKPGLGMRIAEAIARSGMSREGVARALQERGLKTKARDLRRWISGKHEPRASVLMNIADVTGQDPEWLFGTNRPEFMSPGPDRDSALAGKDETARRLGQWMLGLEPDVRAFTFFIGEALSQPNGLRAFARVASEAADRMERRTAGEAGTSRKREGAATRRARQKNASER